MNTTDATARLPLLTVAIAAAGSRVNYTEFCDELSKAGLLDQPDVQICIAHAAKQPWETDSNIRIIPCSVGTPFYRLYETILEQTDSHYVALLDAGCPPAGGWLKTVRKQIHNETDIFYGPVDSGWSPDNPQIVGYLIEYAQFQRPLDQSINEYPGNNIVFRRELLATASYNNAGFQKTFFLRQVERESGIKPTACDDMIIVYHKSYSFSYYLRRRLQHGRLYGSGHAPALGNKRFLYACGTLMLPILRYWRILYANRHNTALQRVALRFSVRILICESAWSLGECQGYLAGAPQNEAYLD